MDGAANFVAAQRRDHALDLAPVAKVRDIADVAAPLGARRGFEPGVVAEAFDQLGGVGQRKAAVDERALHESAHKPQPVSRLPTNVVNALLTMFLAMVLAQALWHGPTMQRPTARAGGCFLTLCILAGFVAGLAIRNPMKGILAGTGIGALVALLLWLIDRRRTG